jgi:hypothetical protein
MDAGMWMKRVRWMKELGHGFSVCVDGYRKKQNQENWVCFIVLIR